MKDLSLLTARSPEPQHAQPNRDHQQHRADQREEEADLHMLRLEHHLIRQLREHIVKLLGVLRAEVLAARHLGHLLQRRLVEQQVAAWPPTPEAATAPAAEPVAEDVAA